MLIRFSDEVNTRSAKSKRFARNALTAAKRIATDNAAKPDDQGYRITWCYKEGGNIFYAYCPPLSDIVIMKVIK